MSWGALESPNRYVFVASCFFSFSGPTQDEVIAESEKINRSEPEIKRQDTAFYILYFHLRFWPCMERERIVIIFFKSKYFGV